MSDSLQDAFLQARRSRPETLPVDFADTVMARIHAAIPARPVLRTRDLATFSAIALLLAGAIGLTGGSPQDTTSPPPLTMFQDTSLFPAR